MGKLPNRSDMATIDAPADQFQGGDHKSLKPNAKLSNGAALAKQRKASMSPVRQVMKAVTDLALNPKRKKATKKGSGDNVKTQGEDPKRPAQVIYKNNGGK